MKRVEVHKYRTPTRDNPDCAWSLGIMNLTEAEASMIAQYANGVRSVNSGRAKGMTATDMRDISEGRVDVLDWRNDREAADYVREMKAKRARDEQEQRTRASVLREAYEVEQQLSPEDRRRYLTGVFNSAGLSGVEPSDKPEPDKPRNRFSGLDIE